MVSCTVFHGKEGQHVVVRQCDNVLVIPAVMHRTPGFWHLSTAAQQKICARLNSPANRFKTHTQKKTSFFIFIPPKPFNQPDARHRQLLFAQRSFLFPDSISYSSRETLNAGLLSFFYSWVKAAHLCSDFTGMFRVVDNFPSGCRMHARHLNRCSNNNASRGL